jgi:hypothetical protein
MEQLPCKRLRVPARVLQVGKEVFDVPMRSSYPMKTVKNRELADYIGLLDDAI